MKIVIVEKRNCPSGVFVCQICKKEGFFHPEYIKAGLVDCVICKTSLEIISQNIAEFRNWRFININKNTTGSGKLINFLCVNGVLNSMRYQNFKSGAGCSCPNCFKAKIENARSIKGVKPDPCDCKQNSVCQHNNHEICCPDSCLEWDYVKNNGVKPSECSRASTKKYWFICRNLECKMSYHQSLDRRFAGCRCPFEKFGKVSEDNSLMKTHPAIILEYDHSNTIKISEITAYSIINVKWICKKHDTPFVYFLSPYNKIINNEGCEKCNNIFVEECNRVHKNIYVYLEQPKDLNSIISILCQNHGNFKMSAREHLLGRKCYSCEKKNRDSIGIDNIKLLLETFNYKLGISYYENIPVIVTGYNAPVEISIYIPELNLALEYDGEDHFKSLEEWGGQEYYKNYVISNRIKDYCCCKNKINLVRIPYNVTLTIGQFNNIIKLCQNRYWVYSSYNHIMTEIIKYLDLRGAYYVEICVPSQYEPLKCEIEDSENNKSEIWKNLKPLGFSKYEISSNGRLRTIATGYIFKVHLNYSGYHQVTIMNDSGDSKNKYIHILVAELFVNGKTEEQSTVDHIDRNPNNNFYNNLRWVSRSVQSSNRDKWFRSGRMCVQLNEFKEIIKIWDKIKDAAEFLGVNESNISYACKDESRTCNGFYWRYYEEKIDLNEIWKECPIKSKSKLYASSKGRIRNHKNLILQGSDIGGYLCINIKMIDDKYHSHKIHRLIAQTFISNPENKDFVNHIDGDKLNNQIENLEWVTPKENSVHAIKTGLKDHSLSRNRCRKVEQFDKNGIFITSYISGTEASNKTGILRTSIGKVCRGERKYAGGFIWKLSTE